MQIYLKKLHLQRSPLREKKAINSLNQNGSLRICAEVRKFPNAPRTTITSVRKEQALNILHSIRGTSLKQKPHCVEWHSTSFTWEFLGKGMRCFTDSPERKGLSIAILSLEDITTGHTLAKRRYFDIIKEITIQFKKPPIYTQCSDCSVLPEPDIFIWQQTYEVIPQHFLHYKKNAHDNTEKYNLNAQVQYTSNAKKQFHVFLLPGLLTLVLVSSLSFHIIICRSSWLRVCPGNS